MTLAKRAVSVRSIGRVPRRFISIERDMPLLSTDAKTNLYLSHGRLSIGAEYSGRSARKYKNDCAQALNLRCANTSPPPGCIEDFHLQAVKNARHTTKPL